MRNEVWNHSEYLYISTVAVSSNAQIVIVTIWGDARYSVLCLAVVKSSHKLSKLYFSAVKHFMFHDYQVIEII